ncbi:MAG: hypothetical protein JWM78_2453 [Verrucomicrobiaceae bacterium]|nr:hypothetical protein [Verrucomicrobiaceae bacterium]
MTTPTTFSNAFGTFDIYRRPARHDKSLQAWDAADDYLLETLKTKNLHVDDVLIVNDQFGALGIALNAYTICSWSDSRTAHLALSDNIKHNRLAAFFTPELLPGTQRPERTFDAVLWRIPKTLALFDQQLNALKLCTNADTLVLAAGMLKHLPDRIFESLQRLGDTVALPAQKKARVFHITPHPQHTETAPAISVCAEPSLTIPDYQLTLSAGPNVFARDKFDIGARFFIEQFKQLPRSARIADLGCGNGILGMLAKRMQPSSAVAFFDDSYQAVAAAELNYRYNGFDDLFPAATFQVDDVFSNYNGAAFDLILCNPPFHQGHVVGDQIAWQMFKQSRDLLTPQGELWIVGNRHLQYQSMLKKIFGNCRQIAANTKFVVLAARA